MKRWRIWVTDAAVGQTRFHRTTMATGVGMETIQLPLFVLHHKFGEQYIAHETKIFRIAHNSSNWDSHIVRQLGYKHTFCQNVGSTTKTACPSIFVNKHSMLTCWSIKNLESFFSVSCEAEHRWVTTNCCCTGNIQFKTSYRSTTEAQNPVSTVLWTCLTARTTAMTQTVSRLQCKNTRLQSTGTVTQIITT
jgi:hypothetical protein